MTLTRFPRLLLPLGLVLLTACSQQQTGPIVMGQERECPLELYQGQTLVLTLPSNPTTGFRWVVRDSAATILQSLGPEVYSTPEDAGLVGSAGQSTWRFRASHAGQGRLLLDYQRPWETDVEPADTFDCQISVN